MLRIWEMASLGTAAMALVLAVSPAQAAGCNGHVNAMEWGCAPWDNNNGPQFPHYTKRAAPAHKTATPARVATPPAHAYAPPATSIQPRSGNGLIGHDGGSLIGHDGGSLISPGNRNGVISQGGGNTIATGGGNVVGPGGASMRH
jgi:hypothetical protein